MDKDLINWLNLKNNHCPKCDVIMDYNLRYHRCPKCNFYISVQKFNHIVNGLYRRFKKQGDELNENMHEWNNYNQQ